MVKAWSCGGGGRVTLPSVAGQSVAVQVFDQASIEPFQVWQRVTVAGRAATGMAEQVVDLGAAAVAYVLVHRRIVGRGGLDHPLHFAFQAFGGLGLAADLEQFGEFGAQRGDFAMVLGQAAVAAVVEHGQRIDRAVQGQLAPQAGENVRGPFMGNAGVGEVVEPGGCQRIGRVAQPVEAVTGEVDLEVPLAEGAFSAGGEYATRQRYAGSDVVLAAEAVLQQDQLGIRAQAVGDAGDGLFRVVGLAGQQQAVDRRRIGDGLCLDGEGLRAALFDQGQSTGGPVIVQALFVAQDQADRLARARQAAGPQAAEASGAENMPGAAHQRFATVYNEPAF
ncbi:hypothetical protein L1887_60075 [Cichorium endivia]|nr:hypothetical protein L1887_60075 [Cichorium endivia]